MTTATATITITTMSAFGYDYFGHVYNRFGQRGLTRHSRGADSVSVDYDVDSGTRRLDHDVDDDDDDGGGGPSIASTARHGAEGVVVSTTTISTTTRPGSAPGFSTLRQHEHDAIR